MTDTETQLHTTAMTALASIGGPVADHAKCVLADLRQDRAPHRKISGTLYCASSERQLFGSDLNGKKAIKLDDVDPESLLEFISLSPAAMEALQPLIDEAARNQNDAREEARMDARLNNKDGRPCQP